MEFVNFDKVYVIHCVENEKRYDNILFQMDNNKWYFCTIIGFLL